MLLAGALFALFMMGFWLYCLTDAILTPPGECRGMPKPAWIAVITLTCIGGPVPRPSRLLGGPTTTRSSSARSTGRSAATLRQAERSEGPAFLGRLPLVAVFLAAGSPVAQPTPA